MKKRIEALVVLALIVTALTCNVGAQANPEVYTATLIASEAVAGSGAGRINIRIVSYSSNDEKTSLVEAFKKSQNDGLALLRGMNKGFINIEGQPGRKVYAVFSRSLKNGHELIVVGDHVASKLEKWNNVKVEDHPLAVVHLRFNNSDEPVNGEVFPAVELSVTADGYVDVQTDSSNKVMMIDLARKQ